MVATQLTTHSLPDFHYAAPYHLCGVPDNLCTHILGSVVYTEDVTLVCVIGLPWKKAGALTLKIWHTQVQGLLHSKKCTRLRQWMRHRHYPLSVHNSDRARSKRMCGRPSENHVARPHTQSVQQESLWLWLLYKSSVLGLVGPPACTIFPLHLVKHMSTVYGPSCKIIKFTMWRALARLLPCFKST